MINKNRLIRQQETAMQNQQYLRKYHNFNNSTYATHSGSVNPYRRPTSIIAAKVVGSPVSLVAGARFQLPLPQGHDFKWTRANWRRLAPRSLTNRGTTHLDGLQCAWLVSRRPARTGNALCRAQEAIDASSHSRSVAVSQYLVRGPYNISPPVQLRFLVGQDRSGALDCNVSVYLPQGAQQAGAPGWPMLVLSAGFLLHSGMYGSYAADLASWGLAVVLYDVPELVDDVTMVSVLGSILNACTSNVRVGPYVDARAILLAGHSRGGKLSVLAAANDPRVKGIALLDPVDVTNMTPTGPGYPSALPAMRIACGPPRNIPTLIVGAACNTGIIPSDANYSRFLASCPGPCWFLELNGAGHLQFLDAKVDLLSAFVQSGPTPDEAVRRVSKAAVISWALEMAVPLARGEAANIRQVLKRLKQTARLLEFQASLSWSFKGFDVVGSPTSSGAARSGNRATDRGGAAAAAGTSSSSHQSSTSSSFGGTPFPGVANNAQQTEPGREPQRGPGYYDTQPSASATQATSKTQGQRGDSVGGDSQSSGRGCGWSYEELIRMRARELKTILVERNVDCSDCFEKGDLV
ncbi:hypothetical protein VaNZ11_004625, partial [Volvox africanus]